jgi:hypothetical protein
MMKVLVCLVGMAALLDAQSASGPGLCSALRFIERQSGSSVEEMQSYARPWVL